MRLVLADYGEVLEPLRLASVVASAMTGGHLRDAWPNILGH